MPAARAHFTPKLFRFLRDLRDNNDRDWFQANQQRYEDHVREPALQFISDFGPQLEKISPHFLAVPKKVGGSLFRIHRDVRFSKDKSPYKTTVGIQFRHHKGKDAHTPGYYLHLAPGECFVGTGIWHPDGPSLKLIRAAIDSRQADWKRAKGGKKFRQTWALEGDSLVRPPKGYDADHPLIEDLKRKDFIGVTHLTQKRVTSPGFLTEFTGLCRTATPLMRFLCGALKVDF